MSTDLQCERVDPGAIDLDETQPFEASEEQRRERYRELLEEFRTIQPGVQVLFAFLLTAPFTQRFEEVDAVSRGAWLTALVATAIAVAAFIAPAAFHRLGDRHERHERLLIGVVGMVLGLSALAVAMTAAVLAVVRFVYGPGLGTTVAAGVAGVLALAWYVLPLARRRG